MYLCKSVTVAHVQQDVPECRRFRVFILYYSYSYSYSFPYYSDGATCTCTKDDASLLHAWGPARAHIRAIRASPSIPISSFPQKEHKRPCMPKTPRRSDPPVPTSFARYTYKYLISIPPTHPSHTHILRTARPFARFCKTACHALPPHLRLFQPIHHPQPALCCPKGPVSHPVLQRAQQLRSNHQHPRRRLASRLPPNFGQELPSRSSRPWLLIVYLRARVRSLDPDTPLRPWSRYTTPQNLGHHAYNDTKQKLGKQYFQPVF